MHNPASVLEKGHLISVRQPDFIIRWLASIEDSVDASIQQVEDYIEKHEGGLITTTRNDTNNTKTNRMTITRKQK